MKRCLLSLVMLVLLTSLARAHFIWIVPDKDGKSAQVIFSDTLTPDDPKLLPKIAKTELHLRKNDGTTVALKWKEAKDAYLIEVPGEGRRTVIGTCPYGVVQRGKAEPFLLIYHAKAEVVAGSIVAPVGDSVATKLMPLEIVRESSTDTQPGQYRVLWQGKPLADAEVVVVPPGDDAKTAERKTDKDGLFDLGFSKPGVYGLRARHVEAKKGEHDGKEYKEVRHYATFVVNAQGGKLRDLSEKTQEEPAKADPAASKLLAEARAARALWKDFPGFSADIEVNFDGKTAKGKVHVSPEGKVKLEGLDKDHETWTRRELGSIVGHRLDSGSPRDTPCAFTDDVMNHPLGRSIRVLNDELHSGYRIRGKEIVVVNRAMKDRRFTITVLESITNAEGKYLTTSFVVDYWNLESGELLRSDAFSQTWTRLGKFDLPAVTRFIGASREKPAGAGSDAEPGYSARSLTLTNHKLLEAGK